MDSCIDAHSHFFSRTFFQTLAAQAAGPEQAQTRLDAVLAKTGLLLPEAELEAHVRRWLGEWDRNGVEHAVSFASVPEEAPVLVRAAQLCGGRMTPFALVNPRAPEAPAKLEQLLAKGVFKGLLFFPAMHGYRMDGAEARALLDQARAARVLCVVHCGMLEVKLRDLLGLKRTYDLCNANPLQLVPVANDYGDLTFVVPHFGAGFLRETLMLGKLCSNTCVDSSSSNSWMSAQEQPTDLARVFERALGVFGEERVLFGTDSGTFPRGWRQDLLQDQSKALERIGASPAARQAIFQGNARRLLGLPAAAQPR